MDIWLMRHPAVEQSGICCGRNEVALSPDWLTHLPKVKELLPQPLPRICSSPAPRCLVVAGLLGSTDITTDERLQEVDYGSWEGKSWKDLPQHELLEWLEDPEDAIPHGGESGNELLDRVCDCFETWLEDDSDVFAITHAGWIQALLAILLGTNLSHAFRLDIDHFSLTRIICHDNSVRIAFINKTA